MLTCDHISYRHQLPPVGFSVIPGALLAIYGAQGPLLLRIMANKLRPTLGSVVFEGKPIARNRDYRSLVFYHHGEPLFLPFETVRKAIKRLTWAGRGADELVEAALRYFALSEVADQRCKKLSPALQKRIMLTPLLTQPRPIWLLDHPEKGLDAEGLKQLDALLANRCNQNGIVVLATAREGFMQPLPSLFLKDFENA